MSKRDDLEKFLSADNLYYAQVPHMFADMARELIKEVVLETVEECAEIANSYPMGDLANNRKIGTEIHVQMLMREAARQ